MSGANDGLVWYVSYGSNMAAERLRCYLEGGRPPGGSRENPGARDPSPPRRSIPVDLPGTVYFAGESPQWGGGVAFYDHDEPGPAHARGYLVTREQLADIAAQEMYLDPHELDGDHPVSHLLAGDWDGEPHATGPGRYETLVSVGEVDGAPLLTFTSHRDDHGRERTLPAPAYLETLATGLRESRGWDDDEVEAYLRRIGARAHDVPHDPAAPSQG